MAKYRVTITEEYEVEVPANVQAEIKPGETLQGIAEGAAADRWLHSWMTEFGIVVNDIDRNIESKEIEG